MKILDYDGALCVEPAKEIDITSCNADLLECGIPELPHDYAEFLKITDGYAWNGYEFYGTACCEDDDNQYFLSDICTQNLDFRERYDIEDKLLLGRWDISYYTYSTVTNKYEELDSDSPMLDVMNEFDTFEQLLKKCALD